MKFERSTDVHFVELKSRIPRFGCPPIARIISQTFGVDIDKNVVYRVDADPQVERDAGKRRIPLRRHAIASPFQRDRLGRSKTATSGMPPEGGEMIDEGPHESFHALIGHERHLDPPRVLQSRREEVHRVSAPS